MYGQQFLVFVSNHIYIKTDTKSNIRPKLYAWKNACRIRKRTSISHYFCLSWRKMSLFGLLLKKYFDLIFPSCSKMGTKWRIKSMFECKEGKWEAAAIWVKVIWVLCILPYGNAIQDEKFLNLRHFIINKKVSQVNKWYVLNKSRENIKNIMPA